jgi:hypothetical protein
MLRVPSAVWVRCAVLLGLCSSFLTFSRFTSAANGNLTLAWDPNPDPNVVGYKIYFGSASGGYTNVISAGMATTLTLSNLVEGTSYFFAATDYASDGLESDYSSEVTATLPVPATNRPPTIDALANRALNENAAMQTVALSGITSGATNEAQTLTVTATSSNPSLIGNPTVAYTSPNTTGTLTFTTVAFAFGSGIITVTVNDGGASNNILVRTFSVTVNPVNQAPTLNSIANLMVSANAGLQTVSLSGISAGAPNENQILTVSASSSNPGLIPSPVVNYTSPSTSGSLSFTPVALGSGTATVTVTVNDGGSSNNIVTRSFTVMVNPVNQAPTISALSNRTINANTSTGPIAFTIGDAETPAASLVLSATSDNPNLVPIGNIVFGGGNSNRTVTITPTTGLSGTVRITVAVSDGTDSTSRTMQLKVKPRAPGGLRLSP